MNVIRHRPATKNILTFIDEIPLYIDKESAMKWAKLMGIKGYHKQKWIEGDIEGYMGGVDHSAAVQANTTVIDVNIPKFESKRKYSVPVAQLNQRLQYVIPPTVYSGPQTTTIPILQTTTTPVLQVTTTSVPAMGGSDTSGGY